MLFCASLGDLHTPIFHQGTYTECIRHGPKRARYQRESGTSPPPSCWEEEAPLFLLFANVRTSNLIVVFFLYMAGRIGYGIVKARIVHGDSVSLDTFYKDA